MPVRSLAVLSMHTSPVAQPGVGDGGGMNIYVRSLASALARAGVGCDVYTRAEHPGQPPVVTVEPNFRVFNVPAGPMGPVPKESLPGLVDEFTEAMLSRIRSCGRDYEVLHANYWLSGQVAHRLKHELSLPMIATFHTLALVKSNGLPTGVEVPGRVQGETDIIRCADLILASTRDEAGLLDSLYGADPDRIEVLPPGVDHRAFSPGNREEARARLGHPGGRVLLFVGRIQPLKGLDLAVRALAEIDDAVLWAVGGPSGADGPAELERVQKLAADLGVAERLLILPPRPHLELADYYRAADVCLVPSRTESFGLVALEAAACGTPVVAASVGGLRSIVVDGETGLLVEGRDPLEWATAVALLLDDRDLATSMGARASARSGRWSWCMTAARLRRLCSDLVERTPVTCS
ncbi:MAG TPA: glycosyltransferase [Acidimicrobiia bacterium]|nr:glycosyltransferase [Acidimicrobiia bacterium]